MSATTKNGTLKALIDGIVTEIMVKTTGEQVYLDETTTLSSKIAEMIVAINERAKSTDVTTAITEQVNALRQEILGDTPVEAYNTFTELAAYIAEHKEVSDALTAAIGNKADSSVVESIQATIAALGTLANKSVVSETDLDDALKNKVNTAAEGNHNQANKDVLDAITSDDVANWNSKANIYVGNTQPENLKAGDLWFDTAE